MEYYSAIKSNEVLVHAITWMNLENIMLNEKPDTNAIYYMIPTYEMSRIGKYIESRLMGLPRVMGNPIGSNY